MMQVESDFDFRNVVFIYPQYDDDDARGGNDEDDPDNEDSDDDGGGGGGGDNGMRTDESSFVIEPFVAILDGGIRGCAQSDGAAMNCIVLT